MSVPIAHRGDKTERKARRRRSLRIVCALPAMLAGGACAPFSADGGMVEVAQQAGSALHQDVVKIRSPEEAAATDARVRDLLARPLTAESAVQIALLNNRELQAAYNDLGISEAQAIAASLPPTPTFKLSKLVTSGQFEIERQIVQNVLGLLTLPRRREIAAQTFCQAQVRAVLATLRIAAQARRAYYRAVAENESVAFLEKARLSAEALSELSVKLGQTGAMPKLDQAREHVSYAEMSNRLAAAKLRQRTRREELNRALGLWAEQTHYRLPGALPPLPPPPPALEDIETQAVLSRADLQVARLELTILAKQYGLTRTTRFINMLDVAGINRHDHTLVPQAIGPELPDDTKFNGFEIDFDIPIYDFGEARTRLAEETYMRAVNRLIARAVNVRAEARQAAETYRATYDIARHFDREILPLREIISKQQLLNYSGMLTDAFALVSDARERVLANIEAIDAKRDFWLAKSDLHVAIVGGGAAGEDALMSASPGSAAGQ